MNKNIIPITDLDIPQVTHLACECLLMTLFTVL